MKKIMITIIIIGICFLIVNFVISKDREYQVNKIEKKITHPIKIKENEPYGILINKNHNIKEIIYYGDSEKVLNQGLGQSTKSHLPGQNKPILIGGHNGTFFRNLFALKTGDIIKIKTGYGIFKYQVTKIEEKQAQKFNALILNTDQELLILYACKQYEIGSDNRYFVYAKKVV